MPRADFEPSEQALRRFAQRIASWSPSDDKESVQKSLLLDAIEYMQRELPAMQNLARLNVEWIGSHFLSLLGEREIGKFEIAEALNFFLRCFREMTLREGVLGSGVRAKVMDYYLRPTYAQTDDEARNADFASNSLPKYLAFEALQELREESKRSEDRIAGWRDELTKLEDRVGQAREQLNKQASQLNFLGLSHAYTGLAQGKRKELKWARVVAILLGAIALAPVAAVFLGVVESPIAAAAKTYEWLTHALAFLGLEIVLIYFFRIALQAMLLARAQLSQLELRASVCAFIDQYAEFIARAAGKDGVIGALSRFESLAFAPIGTTAEVLSAVDGVAHVAELIKEVKK